VDQKEKRQRETTRSKRNLFVEQTSIFVLQLGAHLSKQSEAWLSGLLRGKEKIHEYVTRLHYIIAWHPRFSHTSASIAAAKMNSLYACHFALHISRYDTIVQRAFEGVRAKRQLIHEDVKLHYPRAEIATFKLTVLLAVIK
jgi:hypothetical protein